MSKLVIAAIGPASSVQDGGRPGSQRYGLVPSGAMDRLALATANALVGNEPFTVPSETILWPCRCLIGGPSSR